MLVNFIRKHTRALFIFIFSIMAVPFLFWGIGSVANRKTANSGTSLRLKNMNISAQRLRQSKLDAEISLLYSFIKGNRIKTDRQFEKYADWFNKLRKQADITQIAVRQIIMQDAAERFGIKTGKEDIIKWLTAFPLFMYDGSFSIEKYKRVTASYFKTIPSRFEKALSRVLKAEEAANLISYTVLVSRREALQAYKKKNEKASVFYTEFLTSAYIGKTGEIDAAEVKNYYQKHKEEFREPEKINIAYILFDPSEFINKKDITQKDIEDYYKEKGDKSKPLDKQKKAIIETLAKKRAEDVCQRTALDVSISLPEEKNLQDMRKTAEERGLKIKETGFISQREAFIKGIGWAPRLTQTAWAMDPGSVSGLIRAGDKWAIISPVEIKKSYVPALDKVTDKITDILKKRHAEDLARKAAEDVMKKIPKDMPFPMAVRSIGLHPKKTGHITRANKLFTLERRLIKTKNGTVLADIDRYYPIDKNKWEKERKQFTKTYLEQKKRAFLQKYLLK